MTNKFWQFGAVALTLLSLSSAAMAQEATTADSDDTVAASDLQLGEEVTPPSEIGKSYLKETHGDWSIRCIKTETGNDPCQLYQLLHDENGNSVAEISMFALPAGQEAIAGATIAAPLETLLTQQLTMTVDGGSAKRYPFSWCAATGCFARLGLTAADVAAYKRGASATMTIVPVGSPETKVNLPVSLAGFTAGFDAITALGAN